MTPQEKAKQLFDSMRLSAHPILTPDSKDKMAKKCALAAVAHIVATLDEYGETSLELQNMDREFHYWHQVEQEIEKL